MNDCAIGPSAQGQAGGRLLQSGFHDPLTLPDTSKTTQVLAGTVPSLTAAPGAPLVFGGGGSTRVPRAIGSLRAARLRPSGRRRGATRSRASQAATDSAQIQKLPVARNRMDGRRIDCFLQRPLQGVPVRRVDLESTPNMGAAFAREC
jgi:hypothetical protein